MCLYSCDQGLDAEPMVSGTSCSYPVTGRKRVKLLAAESSGSEPLVCCAAICDDSLGDLLDRYKASNDNPMSSAFYSSFCFYLKVEFLTLSCMTYQMLRAASHGFQ